MENSEVPGGETPLEIKHAYLVGALQELRSLQNLLDGRGMKVETTFRHSSEETIFNVISERIIEVENQVNDLVRLLRDKGNPDKDGGPRRFFQVFKINGRVWLDDRFAKIGGFKIALYWRIEIERRGKKSYSCILPPSLPFFLGSADDPAGDPIYTPEDWVGVLENILAFKLKPTESEYGVKDLVKAIEARMSLFEGTFYLDYQDTEKGRIWRVVWGRKSGRKTRELPTDDPNFLIDVLRKIEAMAKFEVTQQQVWDWLDTQELTKLEIATWGEWNGYKVVLSAYRENEYITWRLNYKRNPKRLQRWRAKAVSDLIKAGRFEEIEELN